MYSMCVYIMYYSIILLDFQGGSVLKNPPASTGAIGDSGSIPGSGRYPGEGSGNSIHILACGIPWTEEPGELQSTGSQRVRHD